MKAWLHWMKKQGHKISFIVNLDHNPTEERLKTFKGGTHWITTITINGQAWSVNYSQGSAFCKEPTLEDLLGCLKSDACGVDGHDNWEDWASEFGDPETTPYAEFMGYKSAFESSKETNNWLRHAMPKEAYDKLMEVEW